MLETSVLRATRKAQREAAIAAATPMDRAEIPLEKSPFVWILSIVATETLLRCHRQRQIDAALLADALQFAKAIEIPRFQNAGGLPSRPSEQRMQANKRDG